MVLEGLSLSVYLCSGEDEHKDDFYLLNAMGTLISCSVSSVTVELKGSILL